MRRLVGAVAVGLVGALVSAAAIGCGGSDSDASDADPKPRYSAAAEAPEAFARRLARLLATTERKRDCGDLHLINGRSFTRFGCPPDGALADSMRSFEVVGAEAYGTGGVVDYRSSKAGDGAAILLFVGPGRRWGVSRFGIVTEPTVGTGDGEARAGYRRAAERYVEVVRERDCAGYRELVYHPDGYRGESCEEVLDRSADQARALRRSPGAEPTYAGGNGTFGFFNLETAKPTPANATISVMRTGDGGTAQVVVLDVAPTPTAAEIRKAVRLEAEQRRRSGSMLPSEEDATGRKVDDGTAGAD